MILNVEQLNPIQAVDGNCALGKNGDISFLFMVHLPEKYSLGDIDFDQIYLDRLRFNSMLPANTVVHNQNAYLKSVFEGFPENDTFLQRAFNNHFTGREWMNHLSYMIITLTDLKSIRKSYSNSKFIQPTSKNQYVKIDLNKIKEFAKAVDRAVHYLNNSKYIYLEEFTESQVWQVVMNYIVGFNGRKLTDIQFKPYMQIGDHFYKSYALVHHGFLSSPVVRNVTEETKFSTPQNPYYKSFFEQLGLDFEFNHVVNQYVYLDEHKDHMKELDQRLDRLNTFSAYSRENKLGSQELEKYVDEIISDGTIQLMRSHINIFVWTKEQSELDYIDSKLIASMQELDLLPYQPILKEQAHYFISSIPTNAGCLPRQETFNTELKKSVCFDITETNYSSDEKGIILNDRLTNLPVRKDVYYKPYKEKLISSRNFFILAPSGGGKTVFLLKKIRTFLEDDFTCILIDLGGSGEVLSKLYPDITLHVKYEQGKPLGVNPFHINDVSELDSDKIETLRDFVTILWLKDEDVKKEHKVSLGKIIKDYYSNHSGKYDFYTFYDYVHENKDTILERLSIEDFFPIEEFLHLLSEYYKDGIYEYLFRDYGHIQDIDKKKFIIFELDSIRTNETLLPVVLLMIRDTIDNLVFKNSAGKKLLCFEEAAESIKIPTVFNAIDYFDQTGRKYGCATGLVLQYIGNIPDNPKGNAIIQNTPIYYLFEHDKKFDELQNRLELTDHTIYQLKSVRNDFVSDIKYTELVVCFSNKISNVYRLELPKEELLCYISEKEDKPIILNEYEKTGDMELAINNVIKNDLL
jgi:conjugal transfer ATP-binding protein TraC